MVDCAEDDCIQCEYMLFSNSTAVLPSRCASMIDTAIVVVGTEAGCGFQIGDGVSCVSVVDRKYC